MKLLVTGGAGFIGSAFVRRRLASNPTDRVVVLDKLTYAGNIANLAPVLNDAGLARRVEFVKGDIADRSLVGDLVTDTDAIVNFAAETHVDRSIEDSAQFLSTGVMGVHCLLEAVRTTSRVGATRRPIRFVHVSTDEVYGSVENGSSTEDAQLRPRSPYSAAKAAGDLLILAYHETYGLDVAITRGANTYGPYQFPEKLIPLFITNAIENSPLPLYGDGEQRRDWLFVDDHADAIAAVVDRGTAGGVYNVPAGEERANREVAVEILKRLNKPWSLVRHVADRPGHDRRYAMDGSHIASLGWSPTTTFDHGLDATVAWFKANRDWWMASRTEDWDAYYRRTYTSRLAEAGAGNQVG